MSEQTDQQINSSRRSQTYLSPQPEYPVHTPEFINAQTNLPMVQPYVAEETPCPRCSHSNYAHSTECYACGSQLQQKFKQIRCRYCHTNTTNQLVLCPSCGRELRAAPSPLLTIATPLISVLLGLVLLFGIWQIGDPLVWASQLWQTATSYVSQISRDLEPIPPEISASITPIQDIANMATLPVQSSNTEPIIPAIADAPSGLTVADQIAANLAIINQENTTIQTAPAKSPTPIAIALSDAESANLPETPTATLEPIVLNFAGDEPAETRQEAIVQNNQPLNNQAPAVPVLPTSPPPVQDFNQPANPPVQAVALANIPTPMPVVPTPVPPAPALQNPQPVDSIAQSQPALNLPAQNQPTQNQPVQNPPIQNPPAQDPNVPAVLQNQPPPQQPNPNPPINNQPVPDAQKSFGTGGLAIVPPTPLPPTPIPPTPVPPVYDSAVVNPNSEPTLLPPGQTPPTNTPWPTPTFIPPTSTIPPTAIPPTPVPIVPTPLPAPLPTTVQPTVAPQPVENPPTPVPVVPTPLPTLVPTLIPTTEPTPPPPIQPTVASPVVQSPTDDGSGIQVGAANRRYRLALTGPVDGSVAAGCNQPPILSWTISRPLDDRHQYIVHVGYVTDSEGNIFWVMHQRFDGTQDSWQLDSSFCNLSPAEYGHQWHWYVEAIDKESGTKIAPVTDIWGFRWQ